MLLRKALRENGIKPVIKRSELTDLMTKTLLVDYIYSTMENMSKYKYKMLELESDLTFITPTSSYSISPNYMGVQCLLIFKKIDGVNYSYFVEKQRLSFVRMKVDVSKVNITEVNINLSDEIYNGTIIDGVLLYDNSKFIINDVFCMHGKKLLKDKVRYKLINISKYLESIKDKSSNIELIVNKLYNLRDISNLVSTIIPSSKLSSCIKGLTFYPEYSGMKLIYLYNNCSKDAVIKDPVNSAFVNKDEANVIVPLVKDNHVANIRMKVMNVVDVYQLSLGVIVDKDGKKFIMYKPIGIAYVPTIECSNMCKRIFKDKSVAIMECRYVEETDKWVPLKLSENTKPDLWEDIYSNQEK